MSKPRRSKTCSGKVRYKDPFDAKRALTTLRKSKRKKYPTRWYRCDICKGVHLTSS